MAIIDSDKKSTGVFSTGRALITDRTLRTDKWWLQPALTFGVLISFVIYATFRAFENDNYFAEPLISPFYSPCLSTICVEGAAHFGTPIGSITLFGLLVSPSLFILIFPLGFRMTCYYYRKSYYRSFWMSPPACAVAEPHKTYTGETRAPLILQNGHRWFFYAGLVLNIILTYDAVIAFKNEQGQWGHMSFSKHPARYKAWTIVSRLNHYHPNFAWVSLFGVAFTDFYVRQVASGAITNYYFF